MTTTNSLQMNGWWHSLLQSRDRLLASVRFQRWAASFPLTRLVARRRARETFDLVAGFVYSQILYACVRLNIFEILAEHPQTLVSLAARTSLPVDATQRLVDAAIALKLIERRDRGAVVRFGLGRLGAPLVGNKAIYAMVEHHAMLYADLRDPVALLRGDTHNTALAAYWPYADAERLGGLQVTHVDAYTRLMSVSQPLVADEVLDAFSFKGFRCLLDVGGGDGSFLMAVAARYPKLRLMLFDLPAVTALASQKLALTGLWTRSTVVGGDFHSDALPAGADLISLVRVLHDHDDENVLKLLRAAKNALQPGGTILIAEPMAGTVGAQSMGDAYFGFYLLSMGCGRPRTALRLAELMCAAGFKAPQRIETRVPLQASILVAKH